MYNHSKKSSRKDDYNGNNVQNIPPLIIWVENTGTGEVHHCPKCGASLDDQRGFDPGAETWVCKECLQMLYGDIYDGEQFPGVLWFCDECGDLLNHQNGFRDICDEWACKKCGHIERFETIYDFRFTND